MMNSTMDKRECLKNQGVCCQEGAEGKECTAKSNVILKQTKIKYIKK